MTFDQPFDAIVGRYVLIWQADASAMMQRLVRHVAPGGVVVFHEPDWLTVRSSPPAPIYDRCCRWIIDLTDRMGTPLNMTGRLHRAFVDGGLPAPAMQKHPFIGSGAAAEAWLNAVVDIVETLLSALEANALINVAEVDIETLRAQMITEVVDLDSTVIGRSEVGAWCRIGGGH